MAESEEFQRAFASKDFPAANAELREYTSTLQGGFVRLWVKRTRQASRNTLPLWTVRKNSFPVQSALRGEHPHSKWGQTDYVVASVPVQHGAVLVGMPLPPKFAQTARQIQESQKRYIELAAKRKLFRRTYIGFLLLLTVVVLFASTWLALLLSKLVNRPVAALAAGTEAISKGQLDYRVDIRATDELAELVQSFNSMAEQLESSRHQIEASSRDVGNANEALERRRPYIATVLESIA